MHLDTHVVIWLYLDRLGVFPSAARHLIETEPLAVSPMVALELDLLHEIGRTQGPAEVVLAGLHRSIGLLVSPVPFADVVGAAANLTWTRDPFDRLICAQAVAENQILLTKDRRIHAHLALARWDG
jgi:PIN domain nuclease of toxin-antitoxin system